jgi:hypothetical protein
MKSGDADTGVNVTNKKTVGFQQIALMQKRSPTAGPSTAMASSLLVMLSKS